MHCAFPYTSCGYWHKMVRLHDPLPVFKINGFNYVIEKYEYMVGEDLTTLAFDNGTFRTRWPWSVCAVTFCRVYTASEVRAFYKDREVIQ